MFQIAPSDFYVEYRLVCQAILTEPRPRAEVISTLHGSIQNVFGEYGVQIMSPHYFADPPAPEDRAARALVRAASQTALCYQRPARRLTRPWRS